MRLIPAGLFISLWMLRAFASPPQELPKRDGVGALLPPGAIGRIVSARLRHENDFHCLSLSPDGKLLAAGSEQAILIWEMATGRVVKRLQAHGDRVSSVAFTPNGETLLSAGWDGTLRLWDVKSGRERWGAAGQPVYRAVIAPDGKTAASGGRDASVRLWDLATGKERLKLEGHQGAVTALAFSPESGLVASGSQDKSIRIWDVSGGAERLRLQGHTGKVFALAFSPDGKTLVSGDSDSEVVLWDVATGRERLRLKPEEHGVHSLAFSPDGASIACGGALTARLLDATTGKEKLKLQHRGHVSSLAFSPEGRTLACATSDKTVNLWDLTTGKERLLREGNDGWVMSLAFAPDGGTLAASSTGDGAIRLHDVPSGRQRLRLLGHGRYSSSLAFAPDGRTLASGSNDGTARIWDVSTGEPRLTLPGHGEHGCSVAFSPDGRMLASGSVREKGRLWDTSTGRELQSFEGCLVAFQPEGKILAVYDDLEEKAHLGPGFGGDRRQPHGQIRLWETATGRELWPGQGHIKDAFTLAFSQDGRMLAMSDADGTLRIGDVADGRELLSLKPEGRYFHATSIAFSPDGNMLAIGALDRTVRLWDLLTGKEMVKFSGRAQMINVLAFSPDGAILASGSDDETVLFWTLRPEPDDAPDPADLEALWSAMGGADPWKSHLAGWRMLAPARRAPEKVLTFLRERLQIVPADDAAVRQMIVRLDADDAAVRDKATADLVRIGARADAALREALDKSPSAEAGGRIRQLLQDLKSPVLTPSADARPLRVVTLLERLGTRAAVEFLQAIERESPSPRESRHAKAALERLGPAKK